MMRSLRHRDQLLIVALTAYMGIALACGGGSDNNEDNNPSPGNNSTQNNNNSTQNNNNNTPMAGSTLEGTYAEGLELSAEGDAPHYIARGDVTVSGGDLVIAAGTVIEFEEGASLHIASDAKIIAKGTSAAGIVLRGSAPNAGHWKGVLIDSASQSNVFEYVTVQHAGSAKLATFIQGSAALVLQDGKLKLSNSTISDSKGYGAYQTEAADFGAFTQNTFESNSEGALRTTLNNLAELDGASSYGGAVVVVDGEVTEDGSWPAIDTHYLISNDASVESASITIEAGANFKFKEGAELEFKADSSVSARGTSAAPITFTGLTQESGFWKGIRIDSKSSSNAFDYVSVKHTGSGKLDTFSKEAGLLLAGGRLALTNSTISDSKGYGIELFEASDFLSFSSNTFASNDKGALYMSANNLGEIDGDSTYESPVIVFDGEVTEDATWPAIDSHVEFSERITIEGGTITLEKGSTYVFGDDTDIAFMADSTVIADGEADAKIHLRGKTQEAGFWRGVRIDSRSAENLFDHVIIEHTGSSKLDTFSDFGSLLLTDGRLAVTQSSFLNSSGYGLLQFESSELIEFSNNTFDLNASGAVLTQAAHIGEYDEASTYTGPIVVGRSEDVTTDQRWPNIDSFIRIASSLTFKAGVQTVSAGAELRFATDTQLSFEDDAVFVAVGTSADPIVFRGSTAAPGFWAGLFFGTRSVDSRISHATISHTGSKKVGTFVEVAAIALDDATLRLGNTTFTDLTGLAVFVKDDSTLVDEGSNSYGPGGIRLPGS